MSGRPPRCRPRSCAGRPCRAGCGRPRGGTGCRTGCATASTRPANGVESVWAVAWKPSGRREIESPWLIQTGCSRSIPANSGSSVAVMLTLAGSVLAVVERDDVATELVGHQLCAVADAEDGDATGPDRRVGPRSARVVDRVRAAGQDDRPGAAPFQLGIRRVVRQQLRVDVELAHAARDELGELAAEVEDDDGLAVVGVGRGGTIGGRAIRGGRLERGLEVGLDLGVVRGKDPVAGVRGLAVDGLAAPRRRGCVLLAQSTSSCDPAAPPGWRQCTGRRPARRLTRGCASPPRPS